MNDQEARWVQRRVGAFVDERDAWRRAIEARLTALESRAAAMNADDAADYLKDAGRRFQEAFGPVNAVLSRVLSEQDR